MDGLNILHTLASLYEYTGDNYVDPGVGLLILRRASTELHPRIIVRAHVPAASLLDCCGLGCQPVWHHPLFSSRPDSFCLLPLPLIILLQCPEVHPDDT